MWQRIWAPNSGRIPDGYTATACFGWDLGATGAALGGGSPQGMQGQIVGQIMQQQFGGSVGSENYLILKVLAECAAAIDAPSVSTRPASICANADVRLT
jgi:hypothetical protein